MVARCCCCSLLRLLIREAAATSRILLLMINAGSSRRARGPARRRRRRRATTTDAAPTTRTSQLVDRLPPLLPLPTKGTTPRPVLPPPLSLVLSAPAVVIAVEEGGEVKRTRDEVRDDRMLRGTRR